MNANHDNQEAPANNNSPEFGFNWQNYHEAFEIYHEYAESQSPRRTEQKQTADCGIRASRDDLKIPEENRLLPKPGYLCLYADLLGFSHGIQVTGTDTLPDFYGGALVAAKKHPRVEIYLFSDSCVVFAPAIEASQFINCVARMYSSWLSNGMLPQCFIGSGSYVERKPDFGPPPSNFYGAQVSGSALVDAMATQKSGPLGVRILVSDEAEPLLCDFVRIEPDGKGNLEALLERPKASSFFDCVYYFLCTRSHEPSSRVFQHYAWSIASRAACSGPIVATLALDLVRSKYDREDFSAIDLKAGEASLSYPRLASQAKQTGT